jgi:uncharacterized phage protein gp47/JayE
MAFAARSLDTISKAIRGDLRREMPGTDAAIWPNTLAVFSKVVAMAVHLVELRLVWIYRQIFASTADASNLERHAYEYGLARRPASRAVGYIVGTGTPDTVYPAGIGFLSGTDLYRTASDALASANGDVIMLVASEKTGAAMNRDAGATLNLVDAALQPSLGGQAVVDSRGLGGGADVETDDALRARVLDRKRRPPQGGAYSDYEQFALTVPGVKKAWAWAFADGPGTVGVWFLFDGREDFIPTPADVLVVREAIEALRLIRARLFVSAPIPAPLDITITGLSDDTQATRDAIEASLKAMLYERAKPGVAIEAFVLSRSWVSQAISEAIGEDRHKMVLPADDVTFTGGEYPVLGTVTYQL